MTDSVSIARLVVYLIFALPALYCLWKHGRTGFLGWWYVGVFCGLRIVTGAIGVSGTIDGVGPVILNSIGLSPLLLAVSGVLHEAKRATNPRLNRKLDFFLTIQYHFLVGAGMVLIIVAIANLLSGKDVSSMEIVLDVGSAISSLAWLLLAAWALGALSAPRAASQQDTMLFTQGRVLLFAVFCALFLVAIRLAYAIAYLQLRIHTPLSGFLTSTAVLICLSVVPEMLCIFILLLAGLRSTDVRRRLKTRDSSVHCPSRNPITEKA